MEKGSNNQANILIKLCVYPNIISKSTKHGSKGFYKVITWPGYKRNVICGKIEIKKFDTFFVIKSIETDNLPYQLFNLW
jgi:hypothetical protein